LQVWHPGEPLRRADHQESGYNPLARSIKGAAGLTQLMPDTAKSQSITNVWNIEQNLNGGARVLKPTSQNSAATILLWRPITPAPAACGLDIPSPPC
jgi:hypothetical protein